MITETAERKWVSPSEKSTWNSKLSAITKAMVEDVLTGVVGSHSHKDNYVDMIIKPYEVSWEGDWLKISVRDDVNLLGGSGKQITSFVLVQTGTGLQSIQHVLRNSPEND